MNPSNLGSVNQSPEPAQMTDGASWSLILIDGSSAQVSREAVRLHLSVVCTKHYQIKVLVFEDSTLMRSLINQVAHELALILLPSQMKNVVYCHGNVDYQQHFLERVPISSILIALNH